MRILLVTDVFPNNMDPDFGTFTLERMKCLLKLAEVKVVSPVPYFPSWRILSVFDRWHKYAHVRRHDLLEGVDVFHPRRLVLPKIGGFTSGLFYRNILIRELKRIREEFPFDVIDAHFVWPDGYAALKAGQALDVPVCITAHGTDVNLMPRFPTIKPFITSTLKGASRIIAVSRALADIVISLGAPREKVKVIHNGVDIIKFRRVDQGRARKALGIDEEADLLLSVGSLIPRKGHEYLIDGMEILVHREGLKRLKLIIVGDGELKKELSKRILSKNLSDHVTLAGSIPHGELYQWFSAADLFCLASSREGWPTVLFEAWACGVPVVATAVHGVPEAVSSSRYGLLMERQEAQQVADTVKKAMEMEWNPEEMIAYAKENSWEEVVKQMHAELQAVVEEHRRSR